jgi:hypothetical protein
MLRAGRSGYRIPVGTRFSALIQTVSGDHPASYTMGTGSFPGVKRSGRGVVHPTTSSAEDKGRISSPSGPSLPFLGWTLSLPLTLQKIMVFWYVTPCVLVDVYQVFCNVCVWVGFVMCGCLMCVLWISSATLTEVFPCFSLSCKANARV